MSYRYMQCDYCGKTIEGRQRQRDKNYCSANCRWHAHQNNKRRETAIKELTLDLYEYQTARTMAYLDPEGLKLICSQLSNHDMHSGYYRNPMKQALKMMANIAAKAAHAYPIPNDFVFRLESYLPKHFEKLAAAAKHEAINVQIQQTNDNRAAAADEEAINVEVQDYNDNPAEEHETTVIEEITKLLEEDGYIVSMVQHDDNDKAAAADEEAINVEISSTNNNSLTPHEERKIMMIAKRKRAKAEEYTTAAKAIDYLTKTETRVCRDQNGDLIDIPLHQWEMLENLSDPFTIKHIVKNAATRQGLEKKGLINNIDKKQWLMELTPEGQHVLNNRII